MSNNFFTIFLTPSAMGRAGDIADEVEKTLGIEVAVVPGQGINVYTKSKKTLSEAVAIVGKEQIVEVPGLHRLTLAGAKAELRQHGMALSKRDGEYRVNFRGGREATAYYASDLEDAVATGIDMAKRSR